MIGQGGPVTASVTTKQEIVLFVVSATVDRIKDAELGDHRSLDIETKANRRRHVCHSRQEPRHLLMRVKRALVFERTEMIRVRRVADGGVVRSWTDRRDHRVRRATSTSSVRAPAAISASELSSSASAPHCSAISRPRFADPTKPRLRSLVTTSTGLPRGGARRVRPAPWSGRDGQANC